MARFEATQVVVLDDSTQDADALGTRAVSRVRRWWFVAGAVVLVLVLAGVQSMIDARADAAVARLRTVPGVLDPLGDRLEVVRALGEEETRSMLGSIPLPHEAWASIRVGEDGSQSFTATDLRTGQTLWSTPLLGPNPGRAAGRQKSSGGDCQPGAEPDGAAPTWAVCVVTDGYSTSSVAGGEERVPATSSRVAVLDTTDGHLRTDWAVQIDALVGVLPGQVLVGLRRDGVVRIVAHDAATGAERWRHEDAPALNRSVPAGSWRFSTAGDVASYVDGDRLTVLSADGEVVRTDLPDPGGETLETDRTTGLPALPYRPADGGELRATTTLLARDADPAHDRVLAGRILRLDVDDGSLPGLVLTARDKLYAWDRDSGTLRWDRDLHGGLNALVVRGRVFLCDATSVVALDGRTGEPVWTSDAPSCAYSVLTTDGQDLLMTAITTGTTGPGGLVGYDFGTGQRTRRFGFPAGIVELSTVQGHLVGFSRTFEELAVLG